MDSAEVEQVLSQPESAINFEGPTEDQFVQIAKSVLKLSAQEAIDTVPELLNSVDENYFRLGGVLSVIQDNKYYQSQGYENFKLFIEV